MNVESEIQDLKARLKAIEAVHAAFLGSMAHAFANLAGVTTDHFINAVRKSIKSKATGNDPALVERMKLLSEQNVDDALHLVQHCMKSLDKPV